MGSKIFTKFSRNPEANFILDQGFGVYNAESGALGQSGMGAQAF